MKSMTGFGFSEVQNGKIHISLDLKSYNHRYLDTIINIPASLNPLEPKIRQWISHRIKRGRVEIHIRYRELEEAMTVSIDKKLAEQYGNILRQMMAITGINGELTLSHLLSIDGIIKTDKKNDLSSLWEQILPMLEKAYVDYDNNRTKEGLNTVNDINNQVDVIKENIQMVEIKIPEMEKKVCEKLRSKFCTIVGDEIEETRLLAETAAYLVKYDINEEIVRMKSHLDRFEQICLEEEASGKKLDFLCQELSREINTIGSKSTVLEVNQSVVVMKDALEKIREQLRNVE